LLVNGEEPVKEIRITFKDEDFVAVSRSLVDLGVVFNVEPLEDGPTPATSDRRAARGPGGRPSQARKQAPKTSAKTIPSTLSGAGRLREMAERNRAASGEREQEGQTPTIPEDLSAKLLPYSERKEG
jgi:hypothetical protein